MAVYNITWMDNATSVVDIMQGVAESVAGTQGDFLVGRLIVLSFFIVFMVYGRGKSFNSWFVTTAFLSTILAVILFMAELLDVTSVISSFVVMIMAIVFFMTNK